MKRTLWISVICIVLFSEVFAQHYSIGDTLLVVANSGLRMRTSPNSNAGTIRILEFGEPVYVLKVSHSEGTDSDPSGWLDGEWIYVSTDAVQHGGAKVSGYVFNKYLSSLDIPTHENELCAEPLNFGIPMQEYIIRHYTKLYEEQGREHGEDVDQCVMFFEDGITMTRTVGSGWFKTDVQFEGRRLSEVVNLLRSMLVGEESRQVFEDSLIFYKDKHGHINRIQAGYDVYPTRITQRDDGVIEVSITDFPTG